MPAIRPIFFIILVNLISLFCFSQSREKLKDKSFNPSVFEEFKVEIKKKKNELEKAFNFNEALFIDCRPDSSKIGFALVGQNTEYHRIILPQSAGQYFTQQSRLFIAPGDPTRGEIVFLIKQLWVSEAIVQPKDFGRSMLVGPIDYFSYCYLNTDCYRMKDGQCNYIGNIDTVYSLRKWIANAADDLLKKTLIQSLSKGDSLFEKVSPSRPPFQLDELRKTCRSDFDFAVLKSVPSTPGVYLSYDDFLNNHVHYPNFQVDHDKKTEQLKVDGMEDSLLNHAWGYFDGKDLKIHLNQNYYRLVRSNNTFEVAGPRTITRIFSSTQKIVNTAIAVFISGLASGGFTLLAMNSTNKIMNELVPYQLDVRDGLLY